MKMTKTDYILKSLVKVSNKRWEFFIISRIVNKLDDDIEFVTQQLVRGGDGRRYLTDLYFPQFDLHLEIDERHHLTNEELDRFREMDIVQETNHKVEHLKIFEESGAEKTLKQIKREVDDFVDFVQKRKQELEKNGKFIPWDWENRYSADSIIQRGYIDVDDSVTFRLQAEALRCFGFSGKTIRRGTWHIRDGSGDWVWFPRLYPHYIWNNEISVNGDHIFQRAMSEEAREHNFRQNKKAASERLVSVVVFAKARDSLGSNVLRYVGTFQHNVAASSREVIQFDRIRTREDIRKFFEIENSL
jgi:hypothetical protein